MPAQGAARRARAADSPFRVGAAQEGAMPDPLAAVAAHEAGCKRTQLLLRRRSPPWETPGVRRYAGAGGAPWYVSAQPATDEGLYIGVWCFSTECAAPVLVCYTAAFLVAQPTACSRTWTNRFRSEGQVNSLPCTAPAQMPCESSCLTPRRGIYHLLVRMALSAGTQLAYCTGLQSSGREAQRSRQRATVPHSKPQFLSPGRALLFTGS